MRGKGGFMSGRVAQGLAAEQPPMMHDIISRREFVLPCTDREALRRKLLRVLTEPPTRIDVIDQHVAILGSVVAYSAFFIEGSITHDPDRIIIHLSLCTVDDRTIALAVRQQLHPSYTAASIARKAARHFWQAFRAIAPEDQEAKHPFGSGHVLGC